MVHQKWAICCKRRRFRAKSYKIKIVRNTILNTFYLMTFFLGCILWPQITIEKDQFRTFFSFLKPNLKIQNSTLQGLARQNPFRWGQIYTLLVIIPIFVRTFSHLLEKLIFLYRETWYFPYKFGTFWKIMKNRHFQPKIEAKIIILRAKEVQMLVEKDQSFPTI